MKIHSANYYNTFIEVAEDTKSNRGIKPPTKDKKTVAEMQYELIAKNPYQYTSDDLIFQIFADKSGLAESEYERARTHFFSKGQPCLRTSPLAKTYGFGIHSDSEGKIALYAMESKEYQSFVEDTTINKVKAMKSRK